MPRRAPQSPQCQPQVSLAALVTLWPQTDLSEEKKGAPGEVVTTGAGPLQLCHLKWHPGMHWGTCRDSTGHAGLRKQLTILEKHSHNLSETHTAHGLSLVVGTIPSWEHHPLCSNTDRILLQHPLNGEIQHCRHSPTQQSYHRHIPSDVPGSVHLTDTETTSVNLLLLCNCVVSSYGNVCSHLQEYFSSFTRYL